MDAADLLAVTQQRQEQVDAVLGRFVSLARKRELHPVTDAVLDRLR